MKDSFFFFGTLCDPDVLEIVVGRPVDPATVVPATLAGYRACAVMLDREMAPVLVKDEHAKVRGVVVSKLTDSDITRIAHFEGLDYESGECEVVLDQTPPSHPDRSVTVSAWLSSEFAPKTSVPWDPDLWRLEHKPLFLELAKSWMSFYREGDFENTDFAAADREWDRVRNSWQSAPVSGE